MLLWKIGISWWFELQNLGHNTSEQPKCSAIIYGFPLLPRYNVVVMPYNQPFIGGKRDRIGVLEVENQWNRSYSLDKRPSSKYFVQDCRMINFISLKYPVLFSIFLSTLFSFTIYNPEPKSCETTRWWHPLPRINNIGWERGPPARMCT